MVGRPKGSKKRYLDVGDVGLRRSKRNHPADQPQIQQTGKIEKITDLHVYCLDGILSCLDLRSLFQMAVASNSLTDAACSSYSRRYGMKLVHIEFPMEPLNDCTISQNSSAVTIDDLRTCLQFLRCFGSVVRRIYVDCSLSNSERYEYVDRYINEYCAETLVHITIKDKPNFSDGIFQKPFVNVEKVCILNADLETNLSNLVEWFPNVRRLILTSIRLEDVVCPAKFGHLVDLYIEISNREQRNGFSNQTATDFVRQNPQLQIITIRILDRQGIPFNAFSNIVANNALITKAALEVGSNGSIRQVNGHQLTQFAIAHPLLNELEILRFKITPSDIVDFVRQLNSLNTFYFMIANVSGCAHLLRELSNQWQLTVFENTSSTSLRRFCKLQRKSVLIH